MVPKATFIFDDLLALVRRHLDHPRPCSGGRRPGATCGSAAVGPGRVLGRFRPWVEPKTLGPGRPERVGDGGYPAASGGRAAWMKTKLPRLLESARTRC